MSKVILIIPDLHHRIEQANEIINQVKADEVICLGDVFDDFNDTPEMVTNTAEWFVNFINKPNHIYIAGNHCVHYAYDIPSLRCSGYEQWKYYIINNIVSKEDWNKMKFHHILDNKWLLTHAGLHKLNLPKKISSLYKKKNIFVNKLNAYLESESHNLCKENNWFAHAGFSRGGSQRVGGVTWCDFEREFYPILGINQIFGHTPQRFGFPNWCVLTKSKKDEKTEYRPYNMLTPENFDNPNTSYNIDLDVWGNTHWATWDGKQLKVFNYEDDLKKT